MCWLGPPSPTELEAGESGTAAMENRTKIHSKTVPCLFVDCWPHRHMGTFYLS